ncbi:RNA-binding protein [Mucilaginibacter sp. BJC16-A38]|uniref:RNA recognition motif domain-containing protein n=1 Tax=Mucilaginibacter phenanthrenivorans TaxID=1234842 RepID=UPI0021580D23|nr:RNA-binding protein [Mucilaginibacter phenanthrenivorans]MCR8556554.1 RNA-binding protein [Mucilaginibacter phenanthrenivorans]
MAKLFVVGFPKDSTDVELLEMFSVHGTVNSITIVTDQQTGASKGYGFVAMTDKAGADRAVSALDGMAMGDRKMSVRIAETKNAADGPAPAEPRAKRPRRAR